MAKYLRVDPLTAFNSTVGDDDGSVDLIDGYQHVVFERWVVARINHGQQIQTALLPPVGCVELLHLQRQHHRGMTELSTRYCGVRQTYVFSSLFVIGGDDDLVDDLLQFGIAVALEILLPEYQRILLAGMSYVLDQVLDDGDALRCPCSGNCKIIRFNPKTDDIVRWMGVSEAAETAEDWSQLSSSQSTSDVPDTSAIGWNHNNNQPSSDGFTWSATIGVGWSVRFDQIRPEFPRGRQVAVLGEGSSEEGRSLVKVIAAIRVDTHIDSLQNSFLIDAGLHGWNNYDDYCSYCVFVIVSTLKTLYLQ